MPAVNVPSQLYGNTHTIIPLNTPEHQPKQMPGFLGGYPQGEKAGWYGIRHYSTGKSGASVEEYQAKFDEVWRSYGSLAKANPHVGYYEKPVKVKEVSRGFFKGQAIMLTTGLAVADKKVLCLAEGKGGFAQYFSLLAASLVIMVTLHRPGHVAPTLDNVKVNGDVAIYLGPTGDDDLMRRNMVANMREHVGSIDAVTFDGGETHYTVLDDGKWTSRFKKPILEVIDTMLAAGGWAVVKFLHVWGAEELVEEMLYVLFGAFIWWNLDPNYGSRPSWGSVTDYHVMLRYFRFTLSIICLYNGDVFGDPGGGCCTFE
uniref:FtsJ domain-containing protein n=1 Tax=Trichuris muris TaxID=70415 RepID=A0A5S6Q4S9_TRIMR